MSKRKRCYKTGKAKFPTEQRAGRAMMRTWSHVPNVNIYDMHTYICPDCKTWHFGHISYYEKKVQKEKAHEPIHIQQTISTSGN